MIICLFLSSSSSSSSRSWRVRCVPCSLVLKVELVPPSLLQFFFMFQSVKNVITDSMHWDCRVNIFNVWIKCLQKPVWCIKYIILFKTITSFTTGYRYTQWRTEGGGVFGVFKPRTKLKFRRYWWSPRTHEQEESASRFPFVVHCVLIRL